MKKNKGMQAAIWILAALPLVILGLVYTRLPEAIPMHWGMDNMVGYGPKWQIWIVGIMTPVMALVFEFLPRIDPKRSNYQKFMSSYQLFQLAIVVFLNLILGIILLEAFRPGTLAVFNLIVILLGFLLLVLGNILPRIRFNYFVGMKTPWTLASETVWNRTHRLGGRMLFAAGIICMLSSLLPSAAALAVLLGASLAATLIPCVMSYVWFQKEKNEEEKAS